MSYCYQGMVGLSAGELFYWILVEKTQKHIGIKDLAAAIAIVAGQPLLPTRGKVAGATKGTSIASVVARRMISYKLKYRLPTITTESIKKIRLRFTKNLATFAGRAVPVVGWVVLATDVAIIMHATIVEYNRYAAAKDQCVE